MIYFIVQEEHGKAVYVKIGISDDPEGRVATLQVGNPHELILWCAIPGGKELEQRIHEHLNERFHVKGEWFLFPPEVKEEIEIWIHEMNITFGDKNPFTGGSWGKELKPQLIDVSEKKSTDKPKGNTLSNLDWLLRGDDFPKLKPEKPKDVPEEFNGGYSKGKQVGKEKK